MQVNAPNAQRRCCAPHCGQTVTVNAMDSFRGPPGVTFTPSVSSDGWLTWTNDFGLPNPDPVNIMGPEGSAPDESIITNPEIDAMFEEV